MNIQTELYKVFYTCALHQSFSRAADALFVSQSSVSQSIKNLEKQLGVSLFNRTTKHVSLTTEGSALLDYVQTAFEHLHAGEEKLERMKNLDEGTLRIGVSDTISKYFLIPHLQRFHQLYPKIKIHIINRPSPQSFEGILSNETDVAIVNLLEETTHPQLSIHTLTQFRDVFIAGEAFKDLQGKTISQYDLSKMPLINLEKNSTTRRFFDRIFSALPEPLTPEIEIGSVDLIIELVRIGLGIGFVPEYTLPDHSNVFPLQLDFEYPSRSIALVHRKSEYPLTTVKKFLEGIQNSAYF